MSVSENIRFITSDGSSCFTYIRGDEERGFTAAEFLRAQDEGREKQYPYLVGKRYT